MGVHRTGSRPDIIEIQRAASRIAHFVHLDKLTFLVTFRPLRKHVAGSIELRKGQKEVIVDVDPLLQDNPDGLRAVLSHEIAHKVMHTHGISAGHGPSFEFENEVFTDITAVFMGLGKLMLNGCQTERVERSSHIEGLERIERVTTHSLKLGYLNLDDLAFVYSLVCAMRRVDPMDILSDLTPAARASVRTAQSVWRRYFETSLHSPTAQEELLVSARERAGEYQDILAAAQYELAGVDGFLGMAHQRLHGATATLDASVREAFDPALQYLYSVQVQSQYDASIAGFETWKSAVSVAAKKVREVRRGLPAEGQTAERSKSLCCPNCGGQLDNMVSMEIAEIACSCSYRFRLVTTEAASDAVFAARLGPEGKRLIRPQPNVKGAPTFAG